MSSSSASASGVAGALVFREDDRAALRITGADRVTWLNGIVTCDITKLIPGALVYGLAVTQKGRILADFDVVMDGEALVVTLPASVVSAIQSAWEKYLVMEDCELAIDEDAAIWRGIGAQSKNVFEAAREAGGVCGAGEMTAVLIGRKADAAKIENAFTSAGGTIGSDDTRDVLRQEAASPRFGVDFDGTVYPQEAALEKRAVSFDKGCYLGQEVVCMLELRGHVKRKLVSLAVDARAPSEKGAAVTTPAGEKIGEVTSSAKSPALGVLAFAMVKASHMAPGTELRIGESKASVRDVGL